MTENCLLLIFDNNPEKIDLFVIPSDHPFAQLARLSNGLYVGSDDTEGHAIEALSDALVTDEGESFKVITPYKGVVHEVIQCGFMM